MQCRRANITFFSAWLTAERLPADVSNLTRTNLLKWLDSLRQRELNGRQDPHPLARTAPVRQLTTG
jgi:hypothetical protein